MAKTEVDRSKLFRKAALDRLSSPEELDVVMQIVRPRTWIATTAVGMALLAVVVWSIVGTIPVTVRAQGILIKTGGLFDIVAPASGPVAEFLVSEGDTVEGGQLVARLEQAELQARLENEQQALEELQAQYEDLSAFTRTTLDFQTETLALQQEAFRLQRNTFEETIAFSEQRLSALEEQLQNEEALLARGLITNRTVLQTRQEYYLASDTIEQARNQLQRLEVSGKQATSEGHSLTSQQEQQLESSRLAISQQERTIRLLEERLVYETEVKSPGPGRVLEVQAKRGDLVSIGRPMVSLQPPGQDTNGLQAVIYVPPADGKFVTPEMNVQLSPFAAPREEFGFLLGKVQYVSEFPSTQAGMVNTLGNSVLVQTLMSQGAPFAVYASLIVDDSPDNPSGFAWSSARGQEIAVNSGTLCNVTITVNERRPLELVVPFFRRVTGFS